MTAMDKKELVSRMEGMDAEEQKLALRCFSSKLIVGEILRRLLELERKLKDVRKITG